MGNSFRNISEPINPEKFLKYMPMSLVVNTINTL